MVFWLPGRQTRAARMSTGQAKMLDLQERPQYGASWEDASQLCLNLDRLSVPHCNLSEVLLFRQSGTRPHGQNRRLIFWFFRSSRRVLIESFTFSDFLENNLVSDQDVVFLAPRDSGLFPSRFYLRDNFYGSFSSDFYSIGLDFWVDHTLSIQCYFLPCILFSLEF